MPNKPGLGHDYPVMWPTGQQHVFKKWENKLKVIKIAKKWHSVSKAHRHTVYPSPKIGPNLWCNQALYSVFKFLGSL